jgi:hypothetical protein
MIKQLYTKLSLSELLSRMTKIQSESNNATYKKMEVRNSRGFSCEVRKILLRFQKLQIVTLV